MSKKSKNRQKEKRRQAKSARKATMKATYAAWTEEGKNQKSKRAVKKSKRQLVKSSKHANVMCGNAGCKKCFPSLNEDFLGRPGKRQEKTNG